MGVKVGQEKNETNIVSLRKFCMKYVFQELTCDLRHTLKMHISRTCGVTGTLVWPMEDNVKKNDLFYIMVSFP